MRKKKLKRKKQTKADFLRSWNIYPGTWMRYSGLKGVYWFWFSRSIRERDYKEHAGLCITCLEYVPPEDGQGGHVFAARNCGFALLFHPMNVHLQHSKCNNPRFTPSAGVMNGKNLMVRYGPHVIDNLLTIKKSGVNKEWNKMEYEEQIRALPAYQNSHAQISNG